MIKSNWDLVKIENEAESCDIYHTLCNSRSVYDKCLIQARMSIMRCVENTVGFVSVSEFNLLTGSAGEGTDITLGDYGKHFTASCYISDADIMDVLYHVRVIDEGDTLPQRFDNYIYLQAVRGEHTTDGFRKLRVIHSPEYHLMRQYTADYWARRVYPSIDNGFISSSKFLDITRRKTLYSPNKHSIQNGVGTQGPSQMIKQSGSPIDVVRCFYVKTWPKEAESWLTRQTHWPDRTLKDKIRKIGYLLVPTGNSKSQENNLEWRCSFSFAEKKLFQTMTKFQRCTFVMLKVLLKQYLSPDVNTDGEKQLLSTYHIKTLFLWCLEDSKLVWEPKHMLDILSYMLEELSVWINKKYLPNYFIPSINLFDGRRVHSREKALICSISAIRCNMLNKIKQSQFFKGQEILDPKLFSTPIHYIVMQSITGRVQSVMHSEAFDKMQLRLLLYSHSLLIEGVICIQPDVDLQLQYLHSALYTDPVHETLKMEVVPGLIDQYRGCIHLAKYCTAARDGRVLPDVLHTAESLLKDTLHLDPCSGYVKLACLYIAAGDLDQAMDRLHAAENNFLRIYKIMATFALTASQQVEVEGLSTEICTAIFHKVFQKWVEAKVAPSVAVTWLEYNTVPDLLQFELIHESTKHITDLPNILECEQGKMVGLDCHLQWPPLSFIKLLKFVCTFNSFNSGRFSTIYIENLAADLIASSLSLTALPGFNYIYKVFNMTAWCYVKLKMYKPAIRMMMVAIETSSEREVMKSCAFSHYLLAYVIEQCLARGSRVLVYKREHFTNRYHETKCL